MAQWECIVCDWIYNEEKGLPEEGIAPGTRFEDIPEDWVCPKCGVGKESFRIVLKKTAPDNPHHLQESIDSHKKPIVIIGTGLAGYNLAKEFRKLDTETPIIMISSDDGKAYSKPMLSTGFTKNMGCEQMASKDAGTMARELHASVWTFTNVTAINPIDSSLEINHTQIVSYSKLVLAWGASTISANLKGDGLEHVYTINDLLDYDDFRTAITNTKVKKIAIIGGGLIGCEFTNDLLNGGFEVETIDPLAYCLPTILPEAAGRAVQNALEELGATFHFGRLATAVNEVEGGVRVTLDDGSTIDADIVLSAIGVTPRINLAKKAGLHCNRGVVVNRFLKTNAKNIYALGDCAEVVGTNLFYVAPLMIGARALAQTLSGKPAKVSYPAMPVSIKTPTCPVVVAPAPRDTQGEWKITQNGNDVIAEYRNNEGQLLGFALTGESTNQKVSLREQLPPLLE